MDNFTNALSRRDFMFTGAGTLLALGGMRWASAADSPPVRTWKTEFRQVAPNVYAFIRGGGGIDNASLSNAGVIVGPDNVTLIDALGPPVHAKELRAAVRSVTDKPITRIINTHHHRDHTNGDYLYEPVEIVMSPIMREQVLKQGIPAHPYDTRPQWQEGMGELKLAPPTTVITSDVTYYYGDLVAQVIFSGPGHTYGDLMVYLPQHKLLFAGDVAFFYVMPAGHASNPAKWLEACNRVQHMDVETIVPGHGPVGGKRDMADMIELMTLLRTEIRRGYDAGKTPGLAAAEARLGRFASYGNPERVAWNAVRYYAEWNGKLTADQDQAAQDQAVAEYQAVLARSKR